MSHSGANITKKARQPAENQLQPCWEPDSGTGSRCHSLLYKQLQAGLPQGTTGPATDTHRDLHKGSQTRGELLLLQLKT